MQANLLNNKPQDGACPRRKVALFLHAVQAASSAMRLLSAFLVLFAGLVRAGSVLGTGSFISVPSLASGHPFWNNPSGDGTGMNIGYFLTGVGGFSQGCGLGSGCGLNLLGSHGLYFSSGSKSDDEPGEFSFLNNATAVQISLLAAFGGKNAAGNVWSGDMPTVIGYYDASATTEAGAAASEVPLWGSGIIPQRVGYTLTLTPYADYGLYATVCTATVLQGGAYKCTATQTYYSKTSFDPAGETTHQHFALFGVLDDTETYYVGFEDLPDNSGEGHGDYNDVILRIVPGQSPPPSSGPTGPPVINPTGGGSLVPEPGTFALAGVGLLALLVYRLRRHRADPALD